MWKKIFLVRSINWYNLQFFDLKPICIFRLFLDFLRIFAIRDHLIFWFLTKISIFDENFDFWRKFWFWRTFRFLTKLLIFDENFAFCPKFRFLYKISLFVQNLENFNFQGVQKCFGEIYKLVQSSIFWFETNFYFPTFSGFLIWPFSLKRKKVT